MPDATTLEHQPATAGEGDSGPGVMVAAPSADHGRSPYVTKGDGPLALESPHRPSAGVRFEVRSDAPRLVDDEDLVDFEEDLAATSADNVPAASPAGAPGSRRFPRWCRKYIAALVAVDTVVGLGLAIVGMVLSRLSIRLLDIPMAALALGIGWPVAIMLAHGYDRSRVGAGSAEMRAVFRAMVGTAAVIGFSSAVLTVAWLRPYVLAIPLAALLSLGGRYLVRKLLHHRRQNGAALRSVVLVGNAPAVASLAARLQAGAHFGMRPVAACLTGLSRGELPKFDFPAWATADDVPDVVREFGADVVAVAAGTDPEFLQSLGWSLEGADVELLVDPGLIEVAGPRLHVRPFEGLPLLYVEEPTFSGWTKAFKTATDTALAIVAAVALAPVWITVALAIKLEDRGPIFFRQTRIGMGGREFTIWKFRSMVPDAEKRKASLQGQNEAQGPLFKMRDDPRITRVGRFIRKFSLDEIPQLINVFNRSMSLVGPRPPLPKEVAEYKHQEARRLLVKPGLTGLGQVSGRSNLSWDDAVRLDLRYVENWTFTGDLLILWKTLFAVLRGEGAY